jgi:hypothetical protein
MLFLLGNATKGGAAIRYATPVVGAFKTDSVGASGRPRQWRQCGSNKKAAKLGGPQIAFIYYKTNRMFSITRRFCSASGFPYQ